MSRPLEVLALDLATTTGWAEGEAGGKVRSGRVRFAPPGSSPAAVFAGAQEWIEARLKAFRPRVIVYEAPLPATVVHGRTNADTAQLLLGLPAIIEAGAHRSGVYDIRAANVQDVRGYFLGPNRRRLKRHEAKTATLRMCRAMGLEVDDDNEADAVALWFYASGILNPRLHQHHGELFARAGRIDRR